MDFDHSVFDPLDLAWAKEIPGAWLQRAGAAVHDLKEAVGDGGEERRIIGVARVDFDDDLAGSAVETGDGSLGERERREL
jgi:hypothetical protein